MLNFNSSKLCEDTMEIKYLILEWWVFDQSLIG